MLRLLGSIFCFFVGILVHRTAYALWTSHNYMMLSVFVGLLLAAVISIVTVAFAKVEAPANLDIPEQAADVEKVEATHDA